MVRLTRLYDPAFAAWGEQSFLPDVDNVIDVPEEAVEALRPFGFVDAPEPEPEKPEPVKGKWQKG